MLTAADTAKVAVQAMKLGAHDYITKPFDVEEIAVVARKALEARALEREVVYFRSQVQPTRFENLVGKSRPMRQVYDLISRVAQTDVTVLVSGESGTGKELAARAIHFTGPRAEKPFVAVNCAGIPENLLETELFGYEKGAFTGADRPKPGKMELAHEGTLFLDEISSLRLDMQGKILRALQEREIERVGGVRTIKLSVRVISATNVDIQKAVKEGKFREDLYYRLNVVPVALPPLRDRPEDIPLLVEHFIRLSSRRFAKRVRGVSEDALRYLTGYPWPGNVRELENMVERLVVLADREVLETQDLPFDVFLKTRNAFRGLLQKSILLKDARDDFEREYISAVLEKTGWNQTAAAKALGVHRNTLILKKEQLRIGKTK